MSEVLVVDDERIIRNGLRDLLCAEGYSVRTARNGEEALAAFRERRPDLVLLDVMMPKRNGFAVCGEIRALDPLTPVVFLTAMDGDSDKVRGFGLGADDFISKTASHAELLARVRRALQRSTAFHSAASEARRLEIAGVVVDFDSLNVGCGGVAERLTKTEADLLWLVASDRGRLFQYDEIIEVLRANGFTGGESTLYSHASHLKRKLGKAGVLLCNERGVGYRLMK
jgi:DNA-binding response OmpR family regulator